MELPKRPQWLDGFALNRAPLRVWGPLLILVLLLLAGLLPEQSISQRLEGEDAADDLGIEVRVNGDVASVSLDGADVQGDAGAPPDMPISEQFDTSVSSLRLLSSRSLSSLNPGTDSSDLSAAVEDHSAAYSKAVFFGMLLMLLAVERMFARRLDVDRRLVEGAAAAGALLLVVFLAISLSNFFDMAAGAATALGLGGETSLLGVKSLPFNYNGATWTLTNEWGPGLAIWCELVSMLIALLLLKLHVLETLDPEFLGQARGLFERGGEPLALAEAEAVGASYLRPTSLAPLALGIVALLLVTAALLTPWVDVSQSYQYREEGDAEWQPATYEWSLSPFGEKGVNSSLFESPSDMTDVSASSFSHSSDEAELDALSDVLSDEVGHLSVGLFLLLLPFGLALLPADIRRNIGMPRLWLAGSLLLAGWTLLSIHAGIVDSIGAALADDGLSADPGDVGIYFSLQSTLGSHGMLLGSHDTSGNDLLRGVVELGWSPGLGLSLLQAASLCSLLAGGLVLTGIHEQASISEDGPGHAFANRLHGDWESGDPWPGASSGGPTLPAVGLSLMLLLALVGGGTLSALLVSKGSVQMPLLPYDVTFEQIQNGEYTESILETGETLEWTFTATENDIDNMTGLFFRAGCADNAGGFGDSNPVGNEQDTYDIEIIPPAEWGEPLQFLDMECTGFLDFNEMLGENAPPEDQLVQAMSPADALYRFHNDSMVGEWKVILTPHPAGSLVGTGLNEDTELYAGLGWDGLGFIGTATLVEDSEDQ